MNQREFEKRILHLFFTSAEPLTITKVAHYLGIPIGEAHRGLDLMVRSGHIELEPDEEGHLLYHLAHDLHLKGEAARKNEHYDFCAKASERGSNKESWKEPQAGGDLTTTEEGASSSKHPVRERTYQSLARTPVAPKKITFRRIGSTMLVFAAIAGILYLLYWLISKDKSKLAVSTNAHPNAVVDSKETFGTYIPHYSSDGSANANKYSPDTGGDQKLLVLVMASTYGTAANNYLKCQSVEGQDIIVPLDGTLNCDLTRPDLIRQASLWELSVEQYRDDVSDTIAELTEEFFGPPESQSDPECSYYYRQQQPNGYNHMAGVTGCSLNQHLHRHSNGVTTLSGTVIGPIQVPYDTGYYAWSGATWATPISLGGFLAIPGLAFDFLHYPSRVAVESEHSNKSCDTHYSEDCEDHWRDGSPNSTMTVYRWTRPVVIQSSISDQHQQIWMELYNSTQEWLLGEESNTYRRSYVILYNEVPNAQLRKAASGQACGPMGGSYFYAREDHSGGGGSPSTYFYGPAFGSKGSGLGAKLHDFVHSLGGYYPDLALFDEGGILEYDGDLGAIDLEQVIAGRDPLGIRWFNDVYIDNIVIDPPPTGPHVGRIYFQYDLRVNECTLYSDEPTGCEDGFVCKHIKMNDDSSTAAGVCVPRCSDGDNSACDAYYRGSQCELVNTLEEYGCSIARFRPALADTASSGSEGQDYMDLAWAWCRPSYKKAYDRARSEVLEFFGADDEEDLNDRQRATLMRKTDDAAKAYCESLGREGWVNKEFDANGISGQPLPGGPNERHEERYAYSYNPVYGKYQLCAPEDPAAVLEPLWCLKIQADSLYEQYDYQDTLRLLGDRAADDFYHINNALYPAYVGYDYVPPVTSSEAYGSVYHSIYVGELDIMGLHNIAPEAMDFAGELTAHIRHQLGWIRGDRLSNMSVHSVETCGGSVHKETTARHFSLRLWDYERAAGVQTEDDYAVRIALLDEELRDKGVYIYLEDARQWGHEWGQLDGTTGYLTPENLHGVLATFVDKREHPSAGRGRVIDLGLENASTSPGFHQQSVEVGCVPGTRGCPMFPRAGTWTIGSTDINLFPGLDIAQHASLENLSGNELCSGGLCLNGLFPGYSGETHIKGRLCTPETAQKDCYARYSIPRQNMPGLDIVSNKCCPDDQECYSPYECTCYPEPQEECQTTDNCTPGSYVCGASCGCNANTNLYWNAILTNTNDSFVPPDEGESKGYYWVQFPRLDSELDVACVGMKLKVNCGNGGFLDSCDVYAKFITFQDDEDIQSVLISAFPSDAGYAPYTVTLTGGAEGGNRPIRYSWNFGDGSNPESGRNVRHTFTEPGLYSAILTVTDSNGDQSQATKDIMVHDFAVSMRLETLHLIGEEYRVNQLLTFRVTGHGGQVSIALAWDFDDGKSARRILRANEIRPYEWISEISHRFSSPGTYTVSIMATSGQSSSQDSIEVVVQ